MLVKGGGDQYSFVPGSRIGTSSEEHLAESRARADVSLRMLLSSAVSQPGAARAFRCSDLLSPAAGCRLTRRVVRWPNSGRSTCQ